MTLKEHLSTPENKRAVAAIEIISDPKLDPEGLRALAPLPEVAAFKDGKKLKTYISKPLLRACYNITAPPPPPVVEQHEGYTVTKTALFGPREMGDAAVAAHKLACFKVLIDMGLPADTEITRRIVDDYLLKGWPESLLFAEAGGFTEKHSPSLRRSYLWMSNRDILVRAVELGLNLRDPGLIVNCLGYYHCDQNNTYSEPGGRDLVIRQLLTMGNKPDPAALARRILSRSRELLDAHRSGILTEVEAVCAHAWQTQVPGVATIDVQAAWSEWIALNASEDPSLQSQRWDANQKLLALSRLIPREEFETA